MMAIDFGDFVYTTNTCCINEYQLKIINQINWDAVGVLLSLLILYYIYKKTKRSRLLGGIGLNTNNLILMGNLKNTLNSYTDQKQAIYKKAFQAIILADTTEEEIYILNKALDELGQYKGE